LAASAPTSQSAPTAAAIVPLRRRLRLRLADSRTDSRLSSRRRGRPTGTRSPVGRRP
jgi:hypothetical protein